MAAETMPVSVPNRTKTERKSGREFVVTRPIHSPVRHVFAAWTKPDLFTRWWTPKSCGLTILSYDADIRTGGTYRIVMNHPAAEQPLAFFGRYIEVIPDSRLVWTNDENGDDGAVTTVVFEDEGDATLLVVHDLYASDEALDEAIASGSTAGWEEQFDQLEELLATKGADV